MYVQSHGLTQALDGATHLLWTTGGAFVPEPEYREFWVRGENIARSRGA
jgi:D-serine dehydratase